MKTFTAEFHSQSHYAFHDIEAETPSEALEKAKEISEYDPGDLDWVSYDELQPLETITIRDDENDCLTKHYDPQFRKSLHADDLRAAAKALLDQWDKGNLSAAVQALQAAVDKMEGIAPRQPTT